jgi:hypothetical protein
MTNIKWIFGLNDAVRETNIVSIELKWNREESFLSHSGKALLKDGRIIFLALADTSSELIEQLNKILNG